MGRDQRLRDGAAFGRVWRTGSAWQEQEGGESSRPSAEWGWWGGSRSGGRWKGLEVW